MKMRRKVGRTMEGKREGREREKVKEEKGIVRREKKAGGKEMRDD